MPKNSDIIHRMKVDGVWVEKLIPGNHAPIEKPKRKKKSKAVKKKKKYKPYKKSDKFYSSHEWAKVRYQALKKSDGQCELCGRSAKDGVTLNVDHIKPRHKYPKLALCLDNLQVLCSACNWGKYGDDETDWREKHDPGYLNNEKMWPGLIVIK